jgi:prolactin regulatory element-binding protein
MLGWWQDGYVRVFKWPSMEIVIDVPKAVKGLKDLDISWDSGFLSAIGDDGPCRVWDLSSSELVGTLQPLKGERFGFSRFSRNGKKAFLFVTLSKANKGFVSVWDMTNWERIGAKKFVEEPITSFAITHHGRRLALGTRGGHIHIVEIDRMESQQVLESAHGETVTSLEFSPNDKVLLSLSSDFSTRVTALDLSKEWKDWQIYMVLCSIFLASVVLFYLLYAYGDSFFQVPQGRIDLERTQWQDEHTSHEEL